MSASIIKIIDKRKKDVIMDKRAFCALIFVYYIIRRRR